MPVRKPTFMWDVRPEVKCFFISKHISIPSIHAHAAMKKVSVIVATTEKIPAIIATTKKTPDSITIARRIVVIINTSPRGPHLLVFVDVRDVSRHALEPKQLAKLLPNQKLNKFLKQLQRHPSPQ